MNGKMRNATAVKLLGVYYTPESTAASLARWAVRTGLENILEPSVGGGALLKAALIRAAELAPLAQRSRPLACDIDEAALAALGEEVGESVDFYAGDFLELDPASCRKFEIVIANPPFTRNHAIDACRRSDLRRRFGIEGPAGIWVHFLAHSVGFLAPGGRIVSIVPASTLFTKYGDAFLRRMCTSFGTVSVNQLPERTHWTGGPKRGEQSFSQRTTSSERANVTSKGIGL